jgi:Fe2+ transport system protein FeoA
VRLDQLPKGVEATVTAVSQEDGHWRKFMAFGIRPGARITVTQRFPAFVVRAGHTQVAIDRQAAALVTVEPTC